jgi:hypothetical protein
VRRERRERVRRESDTSKTTLELHSTKNKLQQTSCKLLQLSAAHPTLHSSRAPLKNENFLFGDFISCQIFFPCCAQAATTRDNTAVELYPQFGVEKRVRRESEERE